jgi:hypothetical protein
VSAIEEIRPLPSPGILVKFPVLGGESGEFVLPAYTAPPGTIATFSTRPGSGTGPAPELRSLSMADAAKPSAVMTLAMSFSKDVTLSNFPVTVFSPPPDSAKGPYAVELFDDTTGALVFAAAQGGAPDGIIAFSGNDAVAPGAQAGDADSSAIKTRAGRTYSFELVRHTGLDLPSAGPACGVPPPVPFPQFDLVSPAPSSSDVPTSVGSLLLEGNPDYYFGRITVTVANAAGTVIVRDANPSPAPSPLPSPRPSPTNGAPYYVVALPPLAPQTTYHVVANVPEYGDVPPVCRSLQRLRLGRFTTGS